MAQTSRRSTTGSTASMRSSAPAPHRRRSNWPARALGSQTPVSDESSMCFGRGEVHGPNGHLGGSDRSALYARDVLPPLENRDPGDETAEDD